MKAKVGQYRLEIDIMITDKTRKILWGRSGNRCTICKRELVVSATAVDEESVVGDECHIISSHPNGPRYDSSYPQEKLDAYENLILLCRVHHKTIADQCENYTVDILRQLKVDHELWVSQKLMDSSKEVQVMEKPYEETLHKQKIRELAKQLQSTIRLPWVGYSFIPELKPGQFMLGRAGISVSVTRDRTIEVPVSIDTNLRGHLLTGGFSAVLDDIELWNRDVALYLSKCHKVLSFLRRRLERAYRVSIPTRDSAQVGFTIYFPITVCADAVEQARRSTHFQNFPYRYENLGLRFGAYLIYRGTQDEDLQPYEELHKELRRTCPKWNQVKDIATIIARLERLGADIVEKLEKFAEMEHLCGRCDLCSN